MFFGACFAVLLISMKSAMCARLLAVYPTPAYSHEMIYWSLTTALAAKGHEIVVLTTHPHQETPPNVTEIDMSAYNSVSSLFLSSINQPRIITNFNYMRLSHYVSERFLNDTKVKALINNDTESFDAVLVEWSTHPSLAAFAEHFNCPLIGIRSVTLRVDGHDTIGNPIHPAYLSPTYYDYNFSFLGKLENIFHLVSYRLLHHFYCLPRAEEVVKKYFPRHKGDLRGVERNVSIVLLNTLPVITGPRPIVPAIVEIGGLHLDRKLKSLPKDINDFLSGAKRGAILFSLGTLLSATSLPQRIMQWLPEFFAEMPYHIVWKSDAKDHKLQNMQNVLIRKWIPQMEILAHKNVRLFISHVGLNSMLEAIHLKVPIIGIPFFADQHHNAKRVEKLAIGRSISLENLSKETLREAVLDVMNNKTYKMNIEKVQALFADQPMKPKDKAVWWIEHVIRHKGVVHLKTDAVDLPWYKYYLVDVLLCLALIFYVFFWVVQRAVRHMFKKLSEKRKKIKRN